MSTRNAYTVVDYAGGMTKGEKLRSLKTRSGLSLYKIARGMGYQDASGIQRYFAPEFDGRLHADWVKRLASVLDGTGNPPITEGEIFSVEADAVKELLTTSRPPLEGAERGDKDEGSDYGMMKALLDKFEELTVQVSRLQEQVDELREQPRATRRKNRP